MNSDKSILHIFKVLNIRYMYKMIRSISEVLVFLLYGKLIPQKGVFHMCIHLMNTCQNRQHTYILNLNTVRHWPDFNNVDITKKFYIIHNRIECKNLIFLSSLYVI